MVLVVASMAQLTESFNYYWIRNTDNIDAPALVDGHVTEPSNDDFLIIDETGNEINDPNLVRMHGTEGKKSKKQKKGE